MLDVGQLRKQIRELQVGSEAAQRQAIQALRQREESDWAEAPADLVQAVVKALQDCLTGSQQAFLHRDVAVTLGNIGPRSKAAIPQLVDLLRDGVPDVTRESAAVALGRIGKSAKAAVDGLVHLVSANRPALVNQAIRALGAIGCGDERVRAALSAVWPSAEHLQNSTAQLAITLCKLGIRVGNVVPVLARTLVSHPEASLRKSAAEGLSYCEPDELDVVPALLNAAQADSNDDVRKMALAGLDQLKLTQEKAIEVCAKQLPDSLHAEAALRKSGPAALPALIGALGSKKSATRVKATRTLANLGEAAAAAAPKLTTALRDPDPEVRLAVAKSLWSISKNAETVVPVLANLLDPKKTPMPESSEARRMFLQTVIEALRRIGPPAVAAIPALRKMVKDSNRHVSESAQSALKLIEPTKPVKVS